MGIATGNDGVIHVDGVAVARLRAWSLNRSAARVDATVMGQTSRSNLAGFLDGTGSLTVAWDETDANGQQALINALQNKTSFGLTLYPKGNVTGRPRITCASAVALGVSDSGGIDELLERPFDFGKSDGEFVEDTVP